MYGDAWAYLRVQFRGPIHPCTSGNGTFSPFFSWRNCSTSHCHLNETSPHFICLEGKAYLTIPPCRPPPKKKQMPVNMYHKSPFRKGFAIRTKFPYVCFVSCLANRGKVKLAYPKSDDFFYFINNNKKKKTCLTKAYKCSEPVQLCLR